MDRLPTPVFLGFPCSSAGKESACNVGDLSSVPGVGWSPGEGKSYPLQYFGLENSMVCIVHEVTKSQRRRAIFTSLYFILKFPGGASSKEPTCKCRGHKRGEFIPGWGRSPGGGNGNPLEYSCWRISWTEEPGGSMGSHRVGYDWSDLACTHKSWNNFFFKKGTNQ